MNNYFKSFFTPQKTYLQMRFLSECVREKREVYIYLSNGIRLSGVLKDFDHVTLLIGQERYGKSDRLLYKRFVSSIEPVIIS